MKNVTFFFHSGNNASRNGGWPVFDWQMSELCTTPAFTFKVKPCIAHRNSWPAAMMLGSTGELDTADHFRLSVHDWRGIFFSFFFFKKQTESAWQNTFWSTFGLTTHVEQRRQERRIESSDDAKNGRSDSKSPPLGPVASDMMECWALNSGLFPNLTTAPCESCLLNTSQGDSSRAWDCTCMLHL